MVELPLSEFSASCLGGLIALKYRFAQLNIFSANILYPLHIPPLRRPGKATNQELLSLDAKGTENTQKQSGC